MKIRNDFDVSISILNTRKFILFPTDDYSDKTLSVRAELLPSMRKILIRDI